ncbi:hypothetical protein GOBAR_AA03167 [Gossypium barbadense]|uniref:Large ribosomal subunit protein eL20 domain-containing protein n=1 Tax=Gossypium barbadense TaxID=3634 RepID=A0A2P5YP84_GOSBA|nr:hypothetical protein GOBAR_AA03167 [Gossypium barbadense]
MLFYFLYFICLLKNLLLPFLCFFFMLCLFMVFTSFSFFYALLKFVCLLLKAFPFSPCTGRVCWVNKSNGQVLAINEIFEKNPTKNKNYGIWLCYLSHNGYHNMYKEYRDTTLNGAFEQMYTEMASRHKVRFPCILIIKIATIPNFHNSKIKYPLVFKKVKPPSRKLKTTYKASKPNLFM